MQSTVRCFDDYVKRSERVDVSTFAESAQLSETPWCEIEALIARPVARIAPDCFCHSVVSAILFIVSRSQREPQPLRQPRIHQLVVFTYSGAVGDLSPIRSLQNYAVLMQAAQLRVLIVGIELTETERQSVLRVCGQTELVQFFDCKPCVGHRTQLLHTFELQRRAMALAAVRPDVASPKRVPSYMHDGVSARCPRGPRHRQTQKAASANSGQSNWRSRAFWRSDVKHTENK